MKTKRLNVMLALIICLTMMIIGVDNVSADTDNVQLFESKIVTTYTYNQGTIEGYFTQGNIAVKNLGFAKKVTVHYTYDGTNWLDQPAQYQKTLSDGTELWSFTTPKELYTPNHQYNYFCKFCIKYEVNGETYWDNNNGNDYFMQCSSMNSNYPFALGKSVVTLVKANRLKYSINGTIGLKNLAYDKDVKVIYTTDNWNTSQEINANYVASYNNNTELWSFDSGENIYYALQGRYKIVYTVNGVTYEDDNYGRDYTFNAVFPGYE